MIQKKKKKKLNCLAGLCKALLLENAALLGATLTMWSNDLNFVYITVH